MDPLREGEHQESEKKKKKERLYKVLCFEDLLLCNKLS